MRIQLKGGVWKNTEDEILKAAVMKYGLNQWARISSLLVRKSAKQCKARWYEWLDPAIKKTEWTREEDEKLLHLAKLMPCQWRTIAPIVGRTPAQCLERYERLLDMAVNKEDRYDPQDDPRRLKPGEIDPNPEAKPARPDAVDMDEDEKEMLSEARARLANTRGKKAKRKAREKQLEEARRLATLQKKRELKAAGIEQRFGMRIRGIDYSSEVAFEQKPAAGFFDVGEEDKRTREMQHEFRPVTVEELEGKRRKDIEEALIKRDVKKQKIQGRQDAPSMLAREAEEADASAALLRRRGKLMLPAPQVSEVELRQIAKLSSDPSYLLEGPGEGEVTRGLLGEYGPTPLRSVTAHASARTAPSGDRIMMEAQNLARMTSMETPLMGGDNPDLHPSDFSGMTPRGPLAGSGSGSTPNPLLLAATPSRAHLMLPPPAVGGGRLGGVGSIAGVTPHLQGPPGSTRGGLAPSFDSLTPSRGGGHRSHHPGPHMTPAIGMTPLRDELGLNDQDAALTSAHLSSAQQRRQQLALRGELKAGLSSLPAPQNEYQIELPSSMEDDPMEEGEGRVEDEADARARRAREVEQRRMEEERKNSRALQRGLPRPSEFDFLSPEIRPSEGREGQSDHHRAEELIKREAWTLLHRDSIKHPILPSGLEGKKALKASRAASIPVPEIQVFSDQELEAASLTLEAEIKEVKKSMGHDNLAPEDYLPVMQEVEERANALLPGPDNAKERIEKFKSDLAACKIEMAKEAKRATKLEGKVQVLVGGLQQREAALSARLKEVQETLQGALIELKCFEALQEREQRVAPERIEKILELVGEQRKREVDLQERFKALTRERNDLIISKKSAEEQLPASS